MQYRDLPGRYWLHALKWVCLVMNLTAEKSLGWKTPMEVLTGVTQDISAIMIFMIGDKVRAPRYPGADYTGKPGDEVPAEITGTIIGLDVNVGNSMVWEIEEEGTLKIFKRSRCYLINDPQNLLKKETTPKHPAREYITSSPGVNGTGIMPTLDTSREPFTASREGPKVKIEDPDGLSHDDPFHGLYGT